MADVTRQDITEWLKAYAVSTAAVGMSEEADKLLEAVEEINRLRKLLDSTEAQRNEAVSYGLYWEMVGTQK
jgi:hypothetical protein